MDMNYFKTRNKLLQYWLKAAWVHCFFCGRASSRRAIMDNTMVCCARCDRTCGGTKITMSEAQTKYSLKKSELFGGKIPENLGGPPPDPPAVGIIPQRRGLRFGQYTCNNSFTTMFLEDDVRRLACTKHKLEDINDLFVQKQEKSVLRKAKIQENKTNRLNYIRRLAMANGLHPHVTERRIVHRSFDKRRAAIFDMVKADCILNMLGIRFRDSALGYNTPIGIGIGTGNEPSSNLFRYMNTLLPQNKFTKVDSNKLVSKIDRFGFNWAAETRYTRTHKVMNELPFIHQAESSSSSEEEKEEQDFNLSLMDAMPTKNYSTEHTTAAADQQDLHKLIYLRHTKKNTKDSQWETVEIEEWADPVDYCLFESYIREFGAPDIPRPTIPYTELRHIYSVNNPPGGDSDAETAIPDAPWSCGNYPLFVRQVTWDADDADTDVEKVGARNNRLHAEHEALKMRIRRVVREHGWDLLGQDRGAKWRRIMLDEEMAGR